MSEIKLWIRPFYPMIFKKSPKGIGERFALKFDFQWLYPYTSKRIRSLKKEPKLYLWDWSEVEDEAARFENLVASHLLKWTHFITDHEGHKAELHYLRDVDKREVDFLVTMNNKPCFAVEVKLNDVSLAPSLLYFKDRLAIPYVYQVVKRDGTDRIEKGARIISAGKFLAGLV